MSLFLRSFVVPVWVKQLYLEVLALLDCSRALAFCSIFLRSDERAQPKPAEQVNS